MLAVALVAEMAVYYAAQGLSLVQRLRQLCQEYGSYLESTVSKSVTGLDFLDKIAAIMERFRDPSLRDFASLRILAAEDYRTGVRAQRAQCGRAQAVFRGRIFGGPAVGHGAQH